MERTRLEEIARHLREDQLRMLLAVAERLLVAQEAEEEGRVEIAA